MKADQTNKALSFVRLTVITIIAVIAIYTANSCEEPNPEEGQVPLVFTDLTADKDSLNIGETVTFTATATGKDVTYLWSASAGSLLGGGNQVTLTPTPCLTGDIVITCVVRDDYDETKTKTLSVYIFEP
jgi:hypothetical protein